MNENDQCSWNFNEYTLVNFKLYTTNLESSKLLQLFVKDAMIVGNLQAVETVIGDHKLITMTINEQKQPPIDGTSILVIGRNNIKPFIHSFIHNKKIYR